MISCIIIDDEQHAIDLLTSHISKIQVLDVQFATTDPIKAFQYVQEKKPDLIFLDIQMLELNGMQFLKLLKGKSKVILTTAYPEHALEGYEHDIVDYLLKPIVFERFLKSALKAVDIISLSSAISVNSPKESQNENDFIFVKAEGRNKIIKVLLKDIEYVESQGNYLSIHSVSGRIMTLLTIKEIEEKLAAYNFVRIHNSYLVPINKITEIKGNQLVVGKHPLPIGDVYKKNFLNLIEKHVLKGKKHV